MTGADYTKWVETEETRHRDLMKEAGLPSPPPTEPDRCVLPAVNSLAGSASARCARRMIPK